MNRQKKAIFITGTDTSVGKTFIAGLLLNYLRGSGIMAGYQKWVATGCEDLPDDLIFCLKTAGVTLDQMPMDILVPYRFRFASSPHLAADLEGKKIDEDKIIQSFKKALDIFDTLIVEGVGGVMVPLRKDLLLIDLLSKIGIPCLIVARSGLGTINHTLLTIEALRMRSIPILGVVFSDANKNGDDTIIKDNMTVTSSISHVENLGRIPWTKNLEEAKRIFSPIGDSIVQKCSTII